MIKPLESNKYLSRMQIDLADVQSLPDDEWILNAQDHFTKYCHLRPLKAKLKSYMDEHVGIKHKTVSSVLIVTFTGSCY